MSPFCQAPQSPERLRCYYKTGHPLCTIKRCPIEVVFTNPDIMIFHQIMSNAEIDKVITISKPLVRIVRAIVIYCQSTFVSLLLSLLSLYLALMTWQWSELFVNVLVYYFGILKWPWNNKEKRERDEQKTKRSYLLSLEYELVMAIVPFFFQFQNHFHDTNYLCLLTCLSNCSFKLHVPFKFLSERIGRYIDVKVKTVRV